MNYYDVLNRDGEAIAMCVSIQEACKVLTEYERVWGTGSIVTHNPSRYITIPEP